MRYIIMFTITIIISLIILFYPKDYLLKFSDSVTIDYSDITSEDVWTYEIDNDNLLLIQSVNNSWKFKPNKNGNTSITYYYNKNNDGGYEYKIMYEFIIKGNKIIWKSGEAEGLIDYPNPY